MAHLTNFSFECFYEIFTEDASLPLLNRSAKNSKMTKTSNQGGSCLERSLLPRAIFLFFFFFFLHETGLESLKITSARCFLLKCQRKDSKKTKEHRQFRGVLGRCRTAAIDRTTFYACQRCRKTAVSQLFSRLWAVIWRGKAFLDQQCKFLTRKKSLSSENESNCSMTSECVRTDWILP